MTQGREETPKVPVKRDGGRITHRGSYSPPPVKNVVKPPVTPAPPKKEGK